MNDIIETSTKIKKAAKYFANEKSKNVNAFIQNIVNILKSKIDSIGIDDKLIFNKTKDDLLKALNTITEFEHIIKD